MDILTPVPPILKIVFLKCVAFLYKAAGIYMSIRRFGKKDVYYMHQLWLRLKAALSLLDAKASPRSNLRCCFKQQKVQKAQKKEL